MICCRFSLRASWIVQSIVSTSACSGEHHSCTLAKTLSTSPSLFLATTTKAVKFSDTAASAFSLIHHSYGASQPFKLLSLDKVLAYSIILFSIFWVVFIMSMWPPLCNSLFLMYQIASKVINILNESSSLFSPFPTGTTSKKLLALTVNLTISSLVEIGMQSNLNPPQLEK